MKDGGECRRGDTYASESQRVRESGNESLNFDSMTL